MPNVIKHGRSFFETDCRRCGCRFSYSVSEAIMNYQIYAYAVHLKGRTDEAIKDSIERMHRIAEAVFNEKLEIIPSYIEYDPPESCKQAVWYLGESIKKMAEADYFIGVRDTDGFSGCNIERSVARAYGIKSYLVDIFEMFQDVAAIDVAAIGREL